MKILILDDDEDILLVMKTTLRLYKYEVATLSQWQQLFPYMDSFSPDLLILDVMLGGADGRDLCQSIRNNEQTSNLPVVLFSADPEVEKDVDRCGADAFIAKPYELKTLIGTVQNLLKQS